MTLMTFHLQLVNSIAKTYVGTNAYMAVSFHELFENVYCGTFCSVLLQFSLFFSRKGYQGNSMESMQTYGVLGSLLWRYISLETVFICKNFSTSQVIILQHGFVETAGQKNNSMNSHGHLAASAGRVCPTSAE